MLVLLLTQQQMASLKILHVFLFCFFFVLRDPFIFNRARTSGPIRIWAVICRVLLVTFQYVQALLVGRVRMRVVGWAEAATICVSHPVPTVTRPLRPLRGFNPFRPRTSICMITKAETRKTTAVHDTVWRHLTSVCLNVQKLWLALIKIRMWMI